MWIAVAKLADLKPESARVVRAGRKELALIYTLDGLFAMDNACPHSGGALGEGMVEANRIVCPLHGWEFDCKSGACLTEKGVTQRRYSVKIEKDEVLVEVPESAGVGADRDQPSRGDWVAVSDAAEFTSGTARTVTASGTAIALVSSSDGWFALDNACAHEGGPLGEGSVQGTAVTCPLHGWKFDCKSGQCLTERPYRQRTYETKVEEGKVWVRMIKSPRVPAAPAKPAAADAATQKSPVEAWKSAKHGLDVWPDVLRYAQLATPMSKIDTPDLERMKWHGFFYRRNNDNDHYMCRIRIPGCEMTSEQARALAYIAYKSGYSLLDVTTRGNIQIQGLTIEQLPAVRSALEKVGLTSLQSGHDNVRNITSHPFSGFDPEELLDTRELANQIHAMIIGNREFSDLPRKFNIALTGRRRLSTHAWTQDLSYVANRKPDGELGFQVLLGGNQGQSPHLACYIPVFVPPDQVLDVTMAILRSFRELGDRHNRNQVRFHYLIVRLGPDRVLLEIQERLGYELERFAGPPFTPSEEEDFIGWFKQKQDDLWAVGISVPVGRLTYDQLEGLAVVARQFGWGTLRTTYDQNILLPGIPSAARRDVAYAIVRYGLSFEPDSATRNVVACTGKQFCNIAVTETKGYAYQLMETLRRRNVQLYGIRLHISGCPSSCAMSYTADIGLKGVKVRRGLRVLDAFDVYLGGGIGRQVQLGILYQKAVPFSQLAEFLEKLINEFHLHRYPNENFSQYWQRKLEGHRAEPLTGDLPTWHCTSCSHLHVGADPPFFCPVCSALRSKFEPVPEPSAPGAAPAAKTVPAAAEDNAAGAERRIWICRSCQSKHAGDLAPKLCPVCGSSQSQFRGGKAAPAEHAVGPSTPYATRTGRRRILIIGGSIAGHTAAQTGRSLDPTARITLVTREKHAFYNRLNLTRLIAKEIERPALFERGPSWYQENEIEVLTETEVIGLDPIQKVAVISEGRELPFDVCVLTHGSSAATPPFYREGLPGVCLLRTLEDVDEIIERTAPGRRVAIIGGGVLGLEAASGVRKRGGAVRVFEFLPQLMPRQLDHTAAALLLEKVRGRQIETYVGVQVKEICGQAGVEGITLSDGRGFEVDLVIVSTGIKPNIEWVKRSGIHCNRGVLVNDRMQTSTDDVFAAGDVAEWKGQVVGLWANAIEQASVAAANAAGKFSIFEGFLPVTILKCLDIPLVSIGEIEEDGGEVTSRIQIDEATGTYRRLILRNGIPMGGILLGTSKGMGEMRRLVEKGHELEKLGRRLMPETVALAAESFSLPV
ncbi:MAG: precorrin-3B synthase [Acidobacteria bacterium]|nr:precorrin-3B synthase [Acidobacteriota bacterium]